MRIYYRSAIATLWSSFFTKLPLELRLIIYDFVLQRPNAEAVLYAPFTPFSNVYTPIKHLWRRKLLLVCKAMYMEVYPKFMSTAVLRATAPDYTLSPTFLKAPIYDMWRIQILELMIENDDALTIEALKPLTKIEDGRVCHIRLGCGILCHKSYLQCWALSHQHLISLQVFKDMIAKAEPCENTYGALAEVVDKFRTVVFTTGPIHEGEQWCSSAFARRARNITDEIAHERLLRYAADQIAGYLSHFEKPQWCQYEGGGDKISQRFIMRRRWPPRRQCLELLTSFG